MLRKQTALIKVDEEDSVFDEVDGHIDALDNSVEALFKDNITDIPKPTKSLVNGDLLGSITAKPPMSTCFSHIQRGKCIGEGVKLLLLFVDSVLLLIKVIMTMAILCTSVWILTLVTWWLFMNGC